MKIKKKQSASGGATINDRFKLQAPPANAGAQAAGVGKGAATAALVGALLALVSTGILCFMLYKHWEFLMPA